FEPPCRFTSLYHLVGGDEQAGRDGEADRFCRLEVDDRLSLAGNFPNSAGELGGSTNPPRSTRRALTAESEIAKLISYLHVAGQDQCRCDRLFSAVVTGAGTTRKGRQRLAYSRFGGKAEIKTAR